MTTSATITLENDLMRVVVAPRRGAELRSLGPPSGKNVLAAYEWAAPVPAGMSQSYGTSREDWLSEYRGGWQELFPNAGPECTVDSVPLPFHGEASASRWEVVDRSGTSVRLRTAARLPLVLERRMTLSEEMPAVLLDEVVRNESGRAVRFAWGHHPAFEALPGMRIDLPKGPLLGDAEMTGELADVEPGASGQWPLIAGRDGALIDVSEVPDGPRERLCYRPGLAAGWAALRHPESGRGVALAWDVDTFRHLWLWQETGTWALPWYARARIVALEPHATWPADGLAAALARGCALELAPGASRSTWLTVGLFEATELPVTGVDRAGHVNARRT
jgi:galactose mutarotase-like enzyme